MLTDGEHYDAAHGFKTDDLAFLVSLTTPGMRVLELACGTGRVAIPLARAGAIVTAVDDVPSMLERARGKAGELPIEWRHGDMRAAHGEHDLAVFAFNALNLLGPDDAIACLAGLDVRRVVLDCFVPVPEKLVAADNLAISSYRVGDTAIRVTGRRTYDPAMQTRRMELAFHTDGGDTHDAFDLHVYYPLELRLVVERAGFRITSIYGDYARGPLVATSRVCIVIAER